MSTSNISERITLYNRAADYLAGFYVLYERGGIRYPISVFPAAPSQRDDIDSVLGGTLPDHFDDSQNLAFRDEDHLQKLRLAGRRIENKPTFILRHMTTTPLKITAGLGMYSDMLMTCDALQHELLDFFAAHATLNNDTQLPRRHRLHRMTPPSQVLAVGAGRSAVIGVATLLVFNHAGTYKAVLARRSPQAATDPLAYHVLPAFVFQPGGMRPLAHEWSIAYHIYREFLEELFALPETEPPVQPDSHPAVQHLKAMLADGRASLHLTGVAVNLLTLRPEICALLLIHDPDWYEEVYHGESGVQAAWETDRRSIVFAPIDSDASLLAALPEDVRSALHVHLVPQAAAAIWLGADRAREILKNRQR